MGNKSSSSFSSSSSSLSPTAEEEEEEEEEEAVTTKAGHFGECKENLKLMKQKMTKNRACCSQNIELNG